MFMITSHQIIDEQATERKNYKATNHEIIDPQGLLRENEF